MSRTNKRHKYLVLVTGMHRSGTSAVAGTLRILGVDFGRKLLGPSYDNEKGFVEDIDFLALNERILKYFGSTWYNPTDLDFKAVIKRFSPRLTYLLFRRFLHRDMYGIKEPRISILMPLYLHCATALGIDVKCIVTKRPRKEIIASIRKRNSFLKESDIDQLIQRYYESIKICTKDIETCEIKFVDLLYKTDMVVRRLNQFLPFLNEYHAKEKELKEYLDPKLRHNVILE